MKYCKKCGNQIEDDAIFCSKCGTKIVGDEVQNEKEPKSKGVGCIIAVLVFILMAILAVAFINQYMTQKGRSSSNNKSNSSTVDSVVKQLVSRDANNNDIEVDSEINIKALGVDLVINPNTDITNLKIEITHYDKKGNLLKTQTVSIGNVKEGVQITKTISITDFSLIDILKVYSMQIRVIGGTVYYFK